MPVSKADWFKQRAAKWNETHFNYLDVIVSSGKIKREFFSRCKELNIDPLKLALKVGISKKAFIEQYQRTEEPHCTKSFSQDKFIEMIELVGIDIKILVKLKPLEDCVVELKKQKIIKE